MNKYPKNQLLPRKEFLHRFARSLLAGMLLLAVSLSAGMIGYHTLAHLSWIDSFLDAAMILSGMGPVSTLTTDASKLFAGCYAIYCGIALISTAGIILAPALHRSLHKFHIEWDGEDK
jgi:hypothetical protein